MKYGVNIYLNAFFISKLKLKLLVYIYGVITTNVHLSAWLKSTNSIYVAIWKGFVKLRIGTNGWNLPFSSFVQTSKIWRKKNWCKILKTNINKVRFCKTESNVDFEEQTRWARCLYLFPSSSFSFFFLGYRCRDINPRMVNQLKKRCWAQTFSSLFKQQIEKVFFYVSLFCFDSLPVCVCLCVKNDIKWQGYWFHKLNSPENGPFKKGTEKIRENTVYRCW